eukprot:s810_g33.t1
MTSVTRSTGTPAQSPKSQATSSVVRVKPTVTAKDGSTGYAAAPEVSSRVAVAPSSSPSWTKISAEGNGGVPDKHKADFSEAGLAKTWEERRQIASQIAYKATARFGL